FHFSGVTSSSTPVKSWIGPSMTLMLFFSQAEDGIRGVHVTGVQTCALPICGGRRCIAPFLNSSPRRDRVTGRARRPGNRPDTGRSEERRVGKEWRIRWVPEHLKKIDQEGRRGGVGHECKRTISIVRGMYRMA